MKSSHFSIGSRPLRCIAAILISLSAFATADAADAPGIYWLTKPRVNENMKSHQSVAAAPALKITDKSVKEKAEQLKKELKAKKADLIELDNGRQYLRFTGPDKRILLYNTDGKETCFVGWSNVLKWYVNSIDLIKASDGDWYFIVNYNKPLNGDPDTMELSAEIRNCLFNGDGKNITDGITGFFPVVIDGEKYINSVGTAYDNSISYEIAPIGPRSKEKNYFTCYAKDKIGFAGSVTDTTHTQVTLPGGGKPFRMFTYPHDSYFVGYYNLTNISDYSSSLNMMYRTILLGNSGMAIEGGDPKKSSVKNEPVVINGELRPGRQLTYHDDYNGMSLKTLDGKTLIDSVSEITFSEPDDAVYFVKRNMKGDWAYYTGAMSLQDTTVRIPALFGNALLARGADGKYQRLVSGKPFENLRPYTEGMTNSSTFDNEGQAQFAQRNYWNCLASYSSLKVNPDTLSALDCRYALTAYQILTSSDLADARTIQSSYLNGIEPEEINKQYSHNWFIVWSLERDANAYWDIEKIGKRYLDIVPKKEMAQAKALVDATRDVYLEALTFKNDELPAAKEVYANIQLKKKLEQEELQRQRELAAQREAAIKAERNAAIAQAFLTGLSNILSSSFGSHSSGGGYRSASTPARAGGATMPAGGGGGGSSYEKPDNTNRIIFLKEQIADWKHKMKRAEESYQRQLSSGDDSREKKRALESAHNRVMECANMVKQFEAELNSLK